MLKSGPTPRTVTFEPSPLELRSIETPAMRCIDSARFVSGNLPMSSATMPSTTPRDVRLRFSDVSSDARMPMTVTVVASSLAGLDAASVGAGAACCACEACASNDSVAAQAAATGFSAMRRWRGGARAFFMSLL